MKGVLGDGLVGVNRTQTLKGHDLVVGGVAGCILYHVELKRPDKQNFVATMLYVMSGV